MHLRAGRHPRNRQGRKRSFWGAGELMLVRQCANVARDLIEFVERRCQRCITLHFEIRLMRRVRARARASVLTDP